MSDYYCVFRESRVSVWPSGVPHESEADAVSYGEAGAYMGDTLVGVFATNTGICPPVGMRADEASHRWLRDPFEIDEAGYVIGWRWELVPR